MAIPKGRKRKEYVGYATHCLNMLTITKDQELRTVQRQMAAEWMRLADFVRRPSRRGQMQMEELAAARRAAATELRRLSVSGCLVL